MRANGEMWALLSSALDGMRECVRIVDGDQQVVFVNRRFSEAFGGKEGEHCYQVFCRKERCENCICQKAMLTGATGQKTRRFGKRILHSEASPVHNEAGEVVGAVEVIRDVTDSLRERRRILERNRQLLGDLRLAERVQHSLVARSDMCSGTVRCFSRYLPCSDIGGDMFSVLNVSEQQLAFYIADVSGHGVAAAMLTVFMNEVIRANVLADMGRKGPANTLQKINEAFLQLGLHDTVYVTLLLGILQRDTGEMTFSNAGHACAPVLYDTDKATALELPGPPISSWVQAPRFGEYSVRMPKGSRLLMYSDGLTDLRQSCLNEDMLLPMIERYGGEALLDKLLQSSGLEASAPRDDVAALLISY